MKCSGTKGREMAPEIHHGLLLYGSAGWRFERHRDPPVDPTRALRHRLLTLEDGKVTSFETIRRTLAGWVQAKPGANP
jgi:hypothetical protein